MTVHHTDGQGDVVCNWFENHQARAEVFPELLLDAVDHEQSDAIDGRKKTSSEDPTQKLPRAIVDLDKRIEVLERKFEDRGYDTRPFFEEHERRIAALEEELPKLKIANEQTSARIGPLRFEHGLCWASGDEVPFCPHCWEGKPHEKRHLQPHGDPGHYWCSKCGNFFKM